MIEKTTPFQHRQPFFWMRFLSPPVVAILLALTLFFGSILIGRILGENVGLGQVLERGRTILHIAAYLGIIAAGQTIVVLSGGEGIDLSIGTTVTLGAMITGWICNEQEALVAPALLAAIGAGLLVGLINGAGIALFKIHPLIMTLSTSGVVGGAMFAIYRGNVRGGASPLMMQWISGSSIFGIQGIIIIWILVAVLMWLLLSRTRFGKHLYAIGINREAARLSGVKVEKMVILAYMCSGLSPRWLSTWPPIGLFPQEVYCSHHCGCRSGAPRWQEVRVRTGVPFLALSCCGSLTRCLPSSAFRNRRARPSWVACW
jgi:ribose transport system permease protein